MSDLEFNIKHAGKVYPITINADAKAADLRAKVEALTLVPQERQKYMVKGGLTDNETLVSSVIKAKATVMVLGTPDANLVFKPTDDTKFLEDLTDKERLMQEDTIPMGLRNMGNTCYFNASLQALYRIKPLREKVLAYNEPNPDLHGQLVIQLRNCFNAFAQRKEKEFTPIILLTVLRKIYPQFAEKDPSTGFYKQQDAEELFTQLLHTIDTVFGESLSSKFEIEFQTTVKDTLNETDVQTKIESDKKLQCHISGTTNFLKNGLTESLVEKVEKRSEATGSNSIFENSKKITKLPEYLTVQFVRFYWKRSTGKKSKILRKVQFPFQLDVADLLTPEYATAKIKVRDELREVDKQREDDLKEFNQNILEHVPLSLTPAERYETQMALEESKREHWLAEFAKKFPKDLRQGENPSSVYNLIGVVTHQGANSDSGHYQAFVRDDADENKWYKYNDDKVYVVTREKVEQLAGGGESDSALILIYKGFGL
ncbi:ubiquitin-specific protease UBP6 [Kluyveromyces lactis]|uniref:Ubiquitin carboxyl-terminal hydrolase n=1 Tax=Kluyveromyces lactis (strain ATCC 8585 / CBS 2359 / DSM 70799 / NBRC 1267 / NRRL Y-1140 / WM37) TaxID=284590 RepID=Q6CX69_KLULA|nr:uncharacterized protein KLLA0_A10791g [Kluyveromyces lactis]CAH03058.1 KLLA0A10791p [Kluyveromyces lactis]|eukprot:XP_451470.1 uncharacterized protein KLLA0_A10791g [Kluyveromyces lactis]